MGNTNSVKSFAPAFPIAVMEKLPQKDDLVTNQLQMNNNNNLPLENDNQKSNLRGEVANALGLYTPSQLAAMKAAYDAKVFADPFIKKVVGESRGGTGPGFGTIINTVTVEEIKFSGGKETFVTFSTTHEVDKSKACQITDPEIKDMFENACSFLEGCNTNKHGKKVCDDVLKDADDLFVSKFKANIDKYAMDSMPRKV